MGNLKDIYKLKKAPEATGSNSNSNRAISPIVTTVGLTPIRMPEQQESALSMFYSELDSDTANYLKAKEYEIVQIGNSYLTKMGKLFKEVQDELASKNKYIGCFGRWIKALDISDETVYNWIHRYNLLTKNFGNTNAIETIEKMPKSLSYEISKPSAPKQLVQAVLDGDITKHKDYQSALAKIRAEEKAKYDELMAEKKSEVEELQEKLEAISDEKAELSEKFKKIKSKYETKLQEIMDSKVEESEEYRQIKEVAESLKSDLKKTETELKKVNSDLRNINLTKKELEDLEYKKVDLLKEIEEIKDIRIDSILMKRDTDKWLEFMDASEKFITEHLIRAAKFTSPSFELGQSFAERMLNISQAFSMFDGIKNNLLNNSNYNFKG